MRDLLTLADAVWYTVRKDILLMEISKVPSLLHEGLGERIVKCLVVGVLNIEIVVNLTNKSVQKVVKSCSLENPHSTTKKVQIGETRRPAKLTHHVEETVVHAVQVRCDCLEEGSRSSGKILEDDTAIQAGQVGLKVLMQRL